jgi:site-specific DNA recombinase
LKKVTKIEENKNRKAAGKKLRVAAYCRVSTDSDAQTESLEAQISHYESYINSRSDWDYAGVYYDEGITGTKKEKRPELKRLMNDCKAGKVDFIISKSISRFSRNTADCLELVRKLLALNIPVYFEKENINTGSMESELFLSILSSMAADESLSISENSKWSAQKRFENGTFKISYPPYGYEWNGAQMVINPEQAEVVKRIFAAALSGQGTDVIARKLNEERIPTKKNGRWSASTVNGMLKNEKYTGDCLFQKTFSDSQFNRHKNHGEKSMYLARDHHEAIISHDDFEAVQKILKQHAKEKNISSGQEKYQKRYAFSGKVICGECGSTFRRRTHYTAGDSYIAWCCHTHIAERNACSMLFVRDDDLKAAFCTCMNKLIFSHRIILKPYLEGIQDSSSDASLHRVQELTTELSKNTEQREELQKLAAQGFIDKIIFNTENNKLLSQADDCRKEIEALNNSTSSDVSKVTSASDLLHFAEKGEMLTDFDEEVFEKYVRRITVKSRTELVFELKCGLALMERIRQ